MMSPCKCVLMYHFVSCSQVRNGEDSFYMRIYWTVSRRRLNRCDAAFVVWRLTTLHLRALRVTYLLLSAWHKDLPFCHGSGYYSDDFSRKPEGKVQLARRSRKLWDNIKTKLTRWSVIVRSDIKSIGLGSVMYCYEKRNEFSGFLQGDISHISKKALICEVSYGLYIIFLQIL